jgi:hypothetical protein
VQLNRGQHSGHMLLEGLDKAMGHQIMWRVHLNHIHGSQQKAGTRYYICAWPIVSVDTPSEDD